MDLKLIEVYDGTTDIVEWIAKVDLVAGIRNIKDVALVIPLRLSGGAFSVYSQLSEAGKRSADKIKAALKVAFASDSFTAYDEFRRRELGRGESPDVYLADLRRLASLFGGIPDKALACAFVAGLPDSVRGQLRSAARLDSLSLSQVLGRARAVLFDEGVVGAVAVVKYQPPRPRPQSGSSNGKGRSFKCFICDDPSHLARACPKKVIRCFRCKATDHLIAQCPENRSEEGLPARAPSSAE